MTRDEFERNRRRFGADVETWPAPFRQEGRAFVASGTELVADPDIAFDRLVLDTALADCDDRALAHKVLARIDADRADKPFLMPRFLLAPAGLAACAAAILMTATVAGYQVSRLRGDLPDSEL